MQQHAPEINQDILDSVQIALLRNRCLTVTYKPVAHPKQKHYILHPLALVQRGVSIYLVARVDPYNDVLLFVIHRMTTAKLLEEKIATAPNGFKLSRYLNQGALQFSDGNVFNLQAYINNDLAGHLEETPISLDQEVARKASSNLLTATVVDSWQLRWWILSQGDKIEVIKPTELRTEIQASLQNALKNYQRASR
nr:WYL domain-containing protein [Idiomarina sp. ATCH4]